MNSPLYCGSGSELRPGTKQPFSAETRPKMLGMAARPLLSPARRPCSLRSGVILATVPIGLKVSTGIGCGRDSFKRGDHAWLAAAHVVGGARLAERVVALADGLNEEDEREDLPLRRQGDSIPLVAGPPAAAMSPKEVVPSMFHGKWAPERPTRWPTKANMAMRPCLISAWRREADGRLLALTPEATRLVPEAALTEAQGIPVAQNRVELLGEGLEVLDRLHGGRRGAHRDRRSVDSGEERASIFVAIKESGLAQSRPLYNLWQTQGCQQNSLFSLELSVLGR